MTEHPSMQFEEVLRAVQMRERAGSNPRISDVVYDSRNVSAGALFVAMQGGTTDGNRFIESALQQGAVALVTDSDSTWQKVRAERPEFAVALVEHGRRALAEISAEFLFASRAQPEVERCDRYQRQNHHNIFVGVDAADCRAYLHFGGHD